MRHPIINPVVKAAKEAIIAVRDAEVTVKTTRLAPAMPKTGSGPVLKQPMFNWKSPNKYR